MFEFFLKRGFVNDVFNALERCYEEATSDRMIVRGLAPNVRVPYMYTLARWLAAEGKDLDGEEHASPALMSSAIHRCRVWVGVHLTKESYEWGALDVAPQVVRQFWKPATEVSEHYYMNLRDRRPEPFLNSIEEALKK